MLVFRHWFGFDGSYRWGCILFITTFIGKGCRHTAVEPAPWRMFTIFCSWRAPWWQLRAETIFCFCSARWFWAEIFSIFVHRFACHFSWAEMATFCERHLAVLCHARLGALVTFSCLNHFLIGSNFNSFCFVWVCLFALFFPGMIYALVCFTHLFQVVLLWFVFHGRGLRVFDCVSLS